MLNKKLTIYLTVSLSVGLVVIFGFFLQAKQVEASPGLTCSVTSGTCDGTVVFKMFSPDNSHAEMPDQTNYNYKVCCSGVNGLGNSCSGIYDTVLKLWAKTNSHVEEKTQTNYSYPVCLSVSGSTGSVSCDYSTDCSLLGADYTCLASISGVTNAHVGDCTAYPTKVCCKAESGPSPPSVSTQPATSIGETTTTLNGKIDSDGGEPCEYQFEYDIDSGEPYAQNTGWSGAGDTKTTGETFSKNIINLNRGTLYYFRAQAKNSQGTTSGGEQTFLTKPQRPLNFVATAGDGQISLSWTKGDGAQRTMVRRSTSGYPATPSDGTQVYFDTGTSFTDTGLTNGTTYYYSAFSEVTSGSLQQYSDKATSSATPTLPPCENHSVSGWAWSENIGWVSFSCQNTMTVGTEGPDYGVDIDPTTGILSGYAWARGTDADVGGIGWISFNQSDLTGCPSGTCQAKLDFTNHQLSGWARALAYGGGWDGWIKLNGANYGVFLDSSAKEFKGWAWGGDDSNPEAVVGWLSFNHLNCDSDNDGVSDQSNYSQCPIGQTVADYKVKSTISLPPTAINLSVDQGDYCTIPLHPIFSWTFSDDTQSAYHIQVDNNSDFSSPELDSGKVFSSSESYAAPSPLSYDTTYYWRLKVWDGEGAESGWVSGPSFTTPLHAYPHPNFSWFPTSPTKEEVVQFCAVKESGVCPEDNSTCYSTSGAIPPPSCSGKSFLWTFPDGTEFATGSSAVSENPRVKFDTNGVKTVSLKITDDVGSCTHSKYVGVRFSLPKWKEIAP